MRRASRPGDDAGIALAASALGICLLLMAGLVAVILVNGLGFFWPKPLLQVTLRDGRTLLGEVAGREPGRLQLKLGNRDLLGLDFIWLDEADVIARDQPADAWYVERREYGPLIGRFVFATPEAMTVRTADGQTVSVRASQQVRAYPANQLGLAGRSRVYLSRLWEFVAGEPREANTEGGVFPALFGTVLMVLLMSLAAVPGGVLAALYLREYAHQGLVVRAVRIAVNNLAGVPSIVFGVFGLGFFVYGLGGGIDRLFFSDRLPTPTFGTGGLLWASLTLALLTVPVVVVAAEEALAAVPRSLREASIAAGATQFQTLWRVVLPAALPGILTGLILAMARGAGEVAPLMLTGVVKLAPELPLNGSFPFLHLDRKFMHLGFHIYDVGFQSPNVEAAKPMVFATTLLLLLVVVLLNLVAIRVRNRLRLRDRVSAF